MTVPVCAAPAPVPLLGEVFHEFETSGGDVLRLHELEDGEDYTVLVSQAAGLVRYRLGDQVRCEGRLGRVPCLRFLGRTEDVTDLVGEKLHERFVREALRTTVARGGVFACLLPDTTPESAMEVVSRIQVRIGNLRLTDPGHAEPIRVTISFGGVAYPTGGDDPEVLFKRADEMLYLSKERGRNRCYFWNPEGEPLLILPDYRDS